MWLLALAARLAKQKESQSRTREDFETERDALRAIRDEILEQSIYKRTAGEFYTQVWEQEDGRFRYDPLKWERCKGGGSAGAGCEISPEGLSRRSKVRVHSHPVPKPGEVVDDLLAPSDLDKEQASVLGPGAIIDSRGGGIQIFNENGRVGGPFR